ncbi:uncharacterized protein MYCGRDRAFT_108640 [Zymoseptoria tritici IPO323]|uniref:Uncharacterized protein n=1 Tax=Zymoseptoria tritici (strain CBS 115943 / IPO323) TaxID=336722 RepID=F9X5Q4_ZYMTI|nr:uncharacterized protein MYCGRDRAFT_108640 [Zymoseptoria tritici IPO323]EGP88839.1 hypothetical protein MYCGRDRAFT_108640 [Zymoseptoria tritici IPO323]
MDNKGLDRLVRQLITGFETLQDEYGKLHSQHQALERKLATARDQYNDLAKRYGAGPTATPPLSLASVPAGKDHESANPTTFDILEKSSETRQAAIKVRAANTAATSLKQNLDGSGNGVRIWSGPAADKQAPEGSSSMMPSISESPLEQDFTVEGRPSQLGCPFAGMARKKLSSHAASVLSRYEQTGSVAAASVDRSHTSRIDGKESLSWRKSRRASMVDPIKAEICGMSDHDTHSATAAAKEPSVKLPQVENADAGVCPIRFLDQHSPEEVATYFENHKHELPRSHEVCVRRYQSNEDQVKELDAKYGTLVSMIQGLGQKHKDYLPEEPEDADEDVASHLSNEKVRKWASSVGAEGPEGDEAADEEEQEEDRKPHFERDLREIRVGESPSRPWGIQVPVQYLEKAVSNVSSKPAQVNSPALDQTRPSDLEAPKQGGRPVGKCPFGHGATGPSPHESKAKAVVDDRPTPPAAEQAIKAAMNINATTTPTNEQPARNPEPRMIFNGPVFFGYSAEDTARILRSSGLQPYQ